MSWWAAAVALASAVAAGWSTALMHYGASGAERGAGAAALARHVLSERRWRLGVAASLVGLGLHAVALHLGSLTVVQPLAVTALFFGMVFRDLLDRRTPPRRTVSWGAITAVGLGLFLVGAGPTGGEDRPDGQAAAVLLGVGVLGVLIALHLSTRVRVHRGLLLGTAGGIVFGLMAGAIKSTTSVSSAEELLTTWPLYTMIVVGLTGFVLNQHIYNQTRLPESLPMLNLVNPLVALTFGILVFAERPSGSVLSLVLEAVGLAIVLAGIFVLGRTVDDQTDQRAPASTTDPTRSTHSG